MNALLQPPDILQFWFDELTNQQRFAKDAVVDAVVRERFGPALLAAMRGELFDWRVTAAGRLAEIILLDQFSRNVFRDTPAAFAQDAQALTLAQELVARGLDQSLSVEQRSFAYMPYMHSESLLIHAQAVQLFSLPGLENNLSFVMKHKAFIERFGRYPHRNGILKRESTTQELEFLTTPGSSF